MATNREIARALRKYPHLTLSEIAAQLGVSRPTINYRAESSKAVGRALESWRAQQKTRTAFVGFTTTEEVKAWLGPNPSERAQQIVEAAREKDKKAER